MVHFEPSDEGRTARRGAALAPVTYLPGAAPGMKRRSPLDSSGLHDDTSPPRGDLSAKAEEGTAEAPLGNVDARSDAETALLHRLRRRSLSIAEAREAVRAAGVDEHDADEIVDRFVQLHYLDDERLADQIIRSHHERKGLGRTAVDAEMRRRGIGLTVIQAKREEAPDDEQERAIEFALKRVRQLDSLDTETAERRLTGFLMRRGYASGVVRAAVAAALASRGASGGRGATVRFR